MQRLTPQVSNGNNKSTTTEISDDNRKEKSKSSERIDNIKNIQENTMTIENNSNGLNDSICEKHEKTRKRNNELLLREKQFIARNSLLTDMLEEKHIRSIYHLFIAILIISFMNSALSDAFNGNGIRLGFRYISINFGKLQQALLIWMFIFIATLLLYPMFCLWAQGRPSCIQNKQLHRTWDMAWLTGFILYLLALVYYSLKWRDYDMSVGSATIVLLEQFRLLMKMHAFVRSNAPTIIYDTTKPLPGFSHYLYFLFAPTFVYRNVYPRTNVIHWGFVTARLLEVVGALFMMSFIVEYYLAAEFIDFGIKSQTWGSIIASVFRSILPASMIMLFFIFLVLHSWMNAWAEALRFADRLFYQDWWNAHSFPAFYRTWNVVVHDYLYTYIYRDIYQLLGHYAYRRVLATIAVFTVSALVHEFVISFMLGSCYPVLFVEFFGFGMPLMFVRTSGFGARCGNVFMWWGLACGLGMVFSFYAMEMAARGNCPVPHSQFLGWKQYFVPRSWTCNGLH